jgi:hypothetical protein
LHTPSLASVVSPLLLLPPACLEGVDFDFGGKAVDFDFDFDFVDLGSEAGAGDDDAPAWLHT